MAKISIGKRVGNWLYLHRATLSALDAELAAAIAEVSSSHWRTDLWTVAKLNVAEPYVCTLDYPHFREVAHPKLRRSVRIDVATGKCSTRQFDGTPNPPILHRKETLLLPCDPDYRKFASLTAKEVSVGLYTDSSRIGHYRGWQDLLELRKVRIENHTLIDDVSGRSAE